MTITWSLFGVLPNRVTYGDAISPTAIGFFLHARIFHEKGLGREVILSEKVQ